jgi:hypothetical protein
MVRLDITQRLGPTTESVALLADAPDPTSHLHTPDLLSSIESQSIEPFSEGQELEEADLSASL